MYLPSLLSTIVLTSFAASCNSYAITGPQGGVNIATGQRPLRQEISSFQKTGPAFDLYILAFRQFTQQDQTQQLSFYQVAGIHGHPYAPWDGVNGNNQTGYCTHGSILFPTWHRPYVALFEQILWNNAQQIAGTYPDAQRAKYQAAAQTFRVPYWDWASHATLPDVVNQPVVSVNAPTGPQSLVNPLYNYTFHPQPSAADFPSNEIFSTYHSTVRYPNSVTGQSQPDLVNTELNKNFQGLRNSIYQMFTIQSDYAEFSNTGYGDGRGGQYQSLEYLHNYIHAVVGHGGHMQYVPYSAFDPIFWLHHANVDRLFAIWETIHPNSSFSTQQADAAGTFTNAPGSNENVTSPLTPFHSDNSGTLYTSKTAQSTRPFGYTYPEIIDWNVAPTTLISIVKLLVNKLYSPTGSKSRRALRANSTHPNTDPADYQYFINIKFDSGELSDPLFVHFFIGAIPQSPTSWATANNLAGTFAALSHTNNLVVGQVALTHTLTDVRLPDLSPQHVVPYLSKQFGYRIQRPDGTVIEAKDFSSLKVAVVGQKVEGVGRGDAFPTYGPFVEYWQATHGLVGGLKKNEVM